MRRLIIALLMILALGIPAFAMGWEVGLSGTPMRNDSGEVDAMVGFHFGFSPWAILYASWDALVAPPSFIAEMTGSRDDTEAKSTGGQYRPGFLNLFDVGIRLILGPIVVFTEIGTNAIHVYDPEAAIGVSSAGGFGANLRLGLGLKFKWWGVSLTGTAVFPSMKELASTLKGLAAEGTRNDSLERIKDGLIPSLMAVIYF